MARKDTAYRLFDIARDATANACLKNGSKKIKRGSNKQSRVNLKLNLSIFQMTTFKNKINNYKRP